MSTVIEKINRKESNNEESEKSYTDERDTEKIIEDEETVQLKNLSTAIEKINRKESNNENQTNQTLKKEIRYKYRMR